jgi:hypothetical protein
MPAQHQTEYCRVDPKTGGILEGPMALPQIWGNVNGFCHLQRKELAKYRWYPVKEDTTVVVAEYRLLFLPEKELVLKLPAGGGNYKPSTKHTIKMLYQMFGFYITLPFYSDVMGDTTYSFPNTHFEQRHRLNCIVAEADYTCMAQTLGHKEVKVTVPCDKIKRLVKDSVSEYNKQLDNLFAGLEDIHNATDAQLVAILDTNLSDYYG